MRDRFTPAPDPPLKITASWRYHSRIESMLSSTDRMKHALACCGVPGTPMLNHTGLLNDARCVRIRYVSSAANASGSSR